MAKKPELVTVYLDQVTRERLKVLAAEMVLSRSGLLRVLVAKAWKDRADMMINDLKNWDEALNQRKDVLMRAGVDPVLEISLCKEK